MEGGLALSLHFDRCVFSLPELCALRWSGEWLVLFKERAAFRCRRTIPQLQTRSRLRSFSGGHRTLRSIPMDSILCWGDRVNRPSSQKDCDDCPAEQVSVRETDRNPCTGRCQKDVPEEVTNRRQSDKFHPLRDTHESFKVI